jgi:hypothetical protein
LVKAKHLSLPHNKPDAIFQESSLLAVESLPHSRLFRVVLERPWVRLRLVRLWLLSVNWQRHLKQLLNDWLVRLAPLNEAVRL